jgi:hypothetical protein
MPGISWMMMTGGDASAVDLNLRVLDEFIHHAAEVALLRDLYSKGG